MVSKLTVEPSRDGNFTACIGSSYLHSKYKPLIEIERIVDQLVIGPQIRAVILLNPGLAYLETCLKTTYIVFSVHSYIMPNVTHENHWTPESNISLEAFVSRIFEKFSLNETFVYAWLPGISADQVAAQELQIELKNLVLSISSFADTSRYFRRSWIRNVARNVFLTELHRVTGRCSNLELCASGPSLELAMPDLTSSSNDRLVVSSSLNFFRDRGLHFTSVIHADGGFWSLPFFSGPLDKPLFFGLRSRIPLGRSSSSVKVPFASSPLEALVFGLRFESSPLKLADQGTVSLNALELSKIICPGPLRIFGFDMANLDLLTHARPHPNQLREEINSDRLSPWYSRLALTWIENEPQVIKKPWYSNYQLRIFKEKLPGHFIDSNCWYNSPYFEKKEPNQIAIESIGPGLGFHALHPKKETLDNKNLKQRILEDPLCKLAAEDLLFENVSDFVESLVLNIGNYV